MRDLWPVYEFRPLPTLLEVFRYAEGRWIPDDGGWDLAFIGLDARGFPVGLGVDLHCQRNILWSWLSERGNWGKHEPKHPRGNAWHYMLRDGATEWGGSWEKHRHPNDLARRAASNERCRRSGCANGSGPEFNPDDSYIAAGLLRERESGPVVVPPSPLGCLYCQKTWPRAKL